MLLIVVLFLAFVYVIFNAIEKQEQLKSDGRKARIARDERIRAQRAREDSGYVPEYLAEPEYEYRPWEV